MPTPATVNPRPLPAGLACWQCEGLRAARAGFEPALSRIRAEDVSCYTIEHQAGTPLSRPYHHHPGGSELLTVKLNPQ